jgi:RNA polymerase primary sigma factor
MRESEARTGRSSSTDSLADYLGRIRRYRLLTREQERALAERIAKGDEDARAALICANLRFVVSVAKKYQHQGVPLPDLINEGNLGLLRASHKFDPSKGIKFITYAVWWIRQAILQALAEQSRVTRIPLNQVATLRRISRRANALAQELGREPTQAEIAEGLDIAGDKLGHVLSLVRPTVSLDMVSPLQEGVRLADMIPDDRAREPDAPITEQALSDTVEAALGALRPREAMVLRLYFGFDGQSGMTLEEIGQTIGVTRERVRQIKESGLGHLRRGRRAEALATWAAPRRPKPEPLNVPWDDFQLAGAPILELT